jgi:uncharacterized ion transporter superfamily protein YfcC
MKKIFVVILIIQTIIIVLLWQYGYLQKIDANSQLSLRIQDRLKLEEQLKQSKKEAERLQQELDSCKNIIK